VRQGRWNNQSMAIQRPPQQLPGDNRHTGPGTFRRPADTVGPAIVTPPILPAAQTKRANQIARSPAEGTSVSTVDRSASYPWAAVELRHDLRTFPTPHVGRLAYALASNTTNWITAIGSAFAAVGTVGAVAFALWQVRRQDRRKLKLRVYGGCPGRRGTLVAARV
jgi:hypothetical protein